MESATDSFTLLDSELNYVEVNKAGLKAFGITREEMIGKNVLDLNPGLKGTERYDKYLEVVKTGKSFSMDDFVPHPRFGDLHLNVRCFKVGDGLGVIVRDITERRRAEEALQESEERYRALFERVPVGLYRTTPDGEILDVNPALLEMLHFPGRETALGANAVSGYADPEDRARWQALMDREGMVRDFEAQWRRRDGRMIWVKDTARAIRDADGRVLYYEGGVEDIAERKRAEEALRESEEQYRTLLESITDGVQVMDRELRYVLVNDELARIARMPKETLLGRKMTDLFPGVEETVFLKTYKKVMETGEPAVASDEFVFEDRQRGGYEVHAYPGPEGLLVIVTDITERKRAEEELRKLSSVVEQSSEGMTIADLEGNLLFVNRAWAQMHGYEAGEGLIGQHLGIFHNQEQVEQDVIPFNQRVKEKGFHTGEVGHTRNDGTPFPTLMTTTLVKDEQGNPYAIAGIAKDITERRRTEEALRQSYMQLQRTLEGTINTLVSAIEMRDPYTAGHQQRVTQLACGIANEMDLPEEQTEGLGMAGLIHDLGKINVPAEILSKPGA